MLTSKEEQASFGFYELPAEVLAQLEAVAPAIVEDEPEGPLSTAARQRRHRQKLKQQRETEGLKTLNLTAIQRNVLAIGLLHYEDVRSRPDLDKENFDRLLALLLPEDPKRHFEREWRPMAPWRERLINAEDVAKKTIQAQAENERLQRDNDRLQAELASLRAELIDIVGSTV